MMRFILSLAVIALAACAPTMEAGAPSPPVSAAAPASAEPQRPGCGSNSECASLLCQQNQCVDAATLLYVDASRCPAQGSGTLDAPFCRVQDGLDATAKANQRVIVLPGTYRERLSTPLFAGSATHRAEAIGIGEPVIAGDGQPGPVLAISSGADLTFDGFRFEGGVQTDGDGIHCVGGSAPTSTRLTLLRSAVASSDRYGVFASQCTVLLDQVTVGPANAQGGVYLSNSDFTLRNLLVHKNGTPGAAGSAFGGVYLDQPSGRSSLVNATIVDNDAGGSLSSGVACSSPPIVFNVVAAGNRQIYRPGFEGSLPEVADKCGASHSAFTGADVDHANLQTSICRESDLFVNPSAGDYHVRLSTMTSCAVAGLGASQVGQIAAPGYDLDGEPRPLGRVDLGALIAR
jgi:hypothetical protein